MFPSRVLNPRRLDYESTALTIELSEPSDGKWALSPGPTPGEFPVSMMIETRTRHDAIENDRRTWEGSSCNSWAGPQDS